MPVQVTQISAEQKIVISVTGRFDYSVHKDFRDAYAKEQAKTFRIDLSKADYMDSSALGMLLLLKEHAEKSNASVSIHSPQPMVRKVLEIANFDKFFKIS